MRNHNGIHFLLSLLLAGTPALAQTPPADTAAPKEVTHPAQVVPIRSLFFSPDEIRALNQAIATYTRNKAKPVEKKAGAEDFLDKLTRGATQPAPTVQAERYFTYPQFFLESLVYHTPLDWSVRINGQRYTLDDRKKADLEIVLADKDRVVVQWTPANMDRVREVVLSEKNMEGVDLKRGLVVFTLRPNQTFSSFVMRVLEGKVRPVTVDNNTATGPVEETAPAPESEVEDVIPVAEPAPAALPKKEKKP
jgi:hypothetical protein